MNETYKYAKKNICRIGLNIACFKISILYFISKFLSPKNINFFTCTFMEIYMGGILYIKFEPKKV